ncbi:MAG TPA: DUF378 domain-containing protein [Aestuariivirgaceae bacterium]|nr:DUF378 domain-containing protein [Aestuariivirgaceae bacterium]
MKVANLFTIVLIIVGGLNWGLVGLFDWNLVAAILGDGSLLSRTVYVLVGLSAVWQIVALATTPTAVTTGRREHSVR